MIRVKLKTLDVIKEQYEDELKVQGDLSGGFFIDSLYLNVPHQMFHIFGSVVIIHECHEIFTYIDIASNKSKSTGNYYRCEDTPSNWTIHKDWIEEWKNDFFDIKDFEIKD